MLKKVMYGIVIVFIVGQLNAMNYEDEMKKEKHARQQSEAEHICTDDYSWGEDFPPHIARARCIRTVTEGEEVSTNDSNVTMFVRELNINEKHVVLAYNIWPSLLTARFMMLLNKDQQKVTIESDMLPAYSHSVTVPERNPEQLFAQIYDGHERALKAFKEYLKYRYQQKYTKIFRSFYDVRCIFKRNVIGDIGDNAAAKDDTVTDKLTINQRSEFVAKWYKTQGFTKFSRENCAPFMKL